MNSSTRVVDRVATFVAGVVLLGIGAAVFIWERGLVFDWPDHPNVGPVQTFLGWDWVPWAAAFGGVLAVFLGLWWLLAHLRRRKVDTIELSGSDGSGQLTVDLGAVAATAAGELARRGDVVSCKSRTMSDRRQIVVELMPALSTGADLASVVAAAERADAAIDSAVGRDVHVRVAMTVRRGTTATATEPRVR